MSLLDILAPIIEVLAIIVCGSLGLTALVFMTDILNFVVDKIVVVERFMKTWRQRFGRRSAT